MPVYSDDEYLRIVRPLPSFVKRDIFDIPIIEPVDIDISKMNNGLWLTGVNNVSVTANNADYKITHAFKSDKKLRSIYNNPKRFLQRAAKYKAVSTLDFSMDIKMDFHGIYSATYQNRWFGAYLQSNGIPVIPTVGWLNTDTFYLCFAGLCDGGIFIISTIGSNNEESYPMFITGYRELRKRFPNTKLICVGKRLEEMDDDVCYVDYKNSFGTWDKKNCIWQVSFLNWNMTINNGGD